MRSHWIHPSGSVVIRDEEGTPDWGEMQKYVGGDLEIVNVLFLKKACHMLVHDEGMVIGLPKNPKATEIYYAASRARGVDPANKEERKADEAKQLENLAERHGIPIENIITSKLGEGMENCIYGSAVVLEGRLR